MFLDKLRMDGRVALVMGAGGGGIGTHTALALAEAGAHVIAVDIVEEQVRDTERRIVAIGGRCTAHVADACDLDSVRKIVDESWKEFGAIHHLANVVGGSRAGDWYRSEEYPEDVFDRVMEFNLRTHFLSCREVARRMIAHDIRGSIVNFASISGSFSMPYQVAYGAAKAAIMGMTRTFAVEWGPHGIRVNAVSPGGGIETPRIQKRDAGTTSIYDSRNWNPLQRSLKPEELASVALFLLSDLASATTGQTITVDAGVTSRMPSGGLERWGTFLKD